MTVGLGLAAVALSAGIWGADARPVPGPGLDAAHHRVLGAQVPNLRFVCIGVASPSCWASAAAGPDPLRADHPGRGGEPRDGLGARHRRAQHVHRGVHPRRRAGRAGRRAHRAYSSTCRPSMGDSLLIFAFIVVVSAGSGRSPGRRWRRPRSRCCSSSRTTTPAGVGDLVVVRRWPRCCSAGRRPRAAAERRDRDSGSLMRRFTPVGLGLALVAVLAILPLLSIQVPGDPPGPDLHAGRAPAARAVHGLRLAGAVVQPAPRHRRPAVLRSRALLRRRCLRPGLLLERTDLSLWPAIVITLAVRAWPRC